MPVAAESEDRESVTEIVLASRERVIARLNAMNEEIVAMVQRLDDSDWPPPTSETDPTSAPTTPTPERH